MGNRRCRECGETYEDSFQHCPVCGADGGRRIPRCRECGSRLTGARKGRCPVCSVRLSRWPGLVRPLLKIIAAVAVGLFLTATYVYSYVPQLEAPAPSWPTPTITVTRTRFVPSATPTTVTATSTRTRTPTSTRVPPTATRTPQITHIVQYGDSLWGIADRYDVSVEALMIANNLTDRDMIREDQILIIPRGTPTPPIVPTPTARAAAPVTRLPIPTSTPKP